MNEMHVSGTVRGVWRYDGNLYSRLMVERGHGRNSTGGPSDFITLCFPDGVAQGLRLARGQRITAHGWLQSRDIVEGLDRFLARSHHTRTDLPSAATEQTLARLADSPLSIRRTVNEVVVERWIIVEEKREE
jgi:hypothetical protein